MRDIEHQVAVAFMVWWAYWSKSKKIDYRLLHAIPNGGLRNKTVAGKLKQAGVRAGVSDYFLAIPRAGFHGQYVELKAGGPGVTRGSPTKEQLEFGELVRARGYDFQIVYGTNEAVKAVEDYLARTE